MTYYLQRNTNYFWMKSLVVAAALFLMAPSVSASALTKEIDSQVWQPFKESWQNMNAKQNVSLHHSEIVRVMGSMKKIEVGSKYLDKIKRMMGMMGKKGVSSTIDFRFSSRIQTADNAWDSGVYRAVMQHPEKGEMVQYAEFNILLSKQDGQWKIKVDSDMPSTESAFERLK